ncbi:hypothetical protein [Chitinibacter sp. GC72]|uniref:hypothetical protein n=1 Tax=Chitinibacter sp. GC72 TaxID=1526917 RepID=UPI0012FC11F7|nr:hypothetical protein [Chitinibacter sp. GC72]
MSQSICLQLPSAGDGQATQVNQAYITSQLEILRAAMDLDVSDYDELAQLDEIIITAVTLDRQAVKIDYQLRFSAFYGCQDIEYHGCCQRVLRGRREGHCLLFTPYTAPDSADGAGAL